MAVTDCRYFTGYKPCGRGKICDDSCAAKQIAGARVLIVHLGALGAVVRSTALLAPLRRKFPRAHITWVTDAPANRLLQGHPHIDRVLATNETDLLSLSALTFDAAFVIDKSLKASGVLARTRADLIYGFVAEPRTGAILPATKAAEELWELGLDDHRKFRVNQKSEIQLVTEALELGPWTGEPYSLPMGPEGERLRDERRRLWSSEGRDVVVGLNTGCGAVLPAKKFTVEFHRRLIDALAARPGVRLVLLGGPEDTLRNQRIAFGKPVFQSPTNLGLPDGYASVAACDIVVTGDSLGMHLAIAAQAWTVAWFGPTCAQEIELYGRGEKILSGAPCGPCWKRACGESLMCYDQVDLAAVSAAVDRGLEKCRQKTNRFNLSSRPPFLATCS